MNDGQLYVVIFKLPPGKFPEGIRSWPEVFSIYEAADNQAKKVSSELNAFCWVMRFEDPVLRD
jgi:hypothetical protein